MSDFRKTLATLVADPAAPDLTVRQLCVLLILRDEPKVSCTVRGMAADLNISKPAITRALDRLEDLTFAERQVNRDDRRSIFARLTKAGREFAAALPATSEMQVAA